MLLLSSPESCRRCLASLMLCVLAAIACAIGILAMQTQNQIMDEGTAAAVHHHYHNHRNNNNIIVIPNINGDNRDSHNEIKQHQQHDGGTEDTDIDPSSSLRSNQNNLQQKEEEEETVDDNDDLLNRQTLVETVTSKMNDLILKLHIDYGLENFENMFVLSNNDTAKLNERMMFKGVKPITGDDDDSASSSAVSLQRLKRKLQMKVLEMQVQIMKKRQRKEDHFRAIAANKPSTTYVVAIGGNSVAAGHGNLYNESYTAYLERDMEDIFNSIGIDFEGRNYGMGGISSGAEISLCSEEVYGSDVDLLVWDFSMTDEKNTEFMYHYMYKGGRNPGRPAQLAMRLGGEGGKRKDIIQRRRIMATLESLGLSMFTSDNSEIRKAIPDTMGMNDEQIHNMPEYVRNFKCTNKIEDGLPYCKEEKWSKDLCPDRKRRTSWHPGYKSNAIDGHMLGLFLGQTLIDALNDLVRHKIQDPHELLDQLQAEEDRIHNAFLQADLPFTGNDGSKNHDATAEVISKFYQDFGSKDDLDGIDVQTLFLKSQSICHTARTPAQTRYLGYVTNDITKIGTIAPVGKETYDTGIFVDDADKQPNINGTMRLAYVKGRERESDRSIPVKIDYRDFFFAHHRDGWSSLAIPNAAEKTAYNNDGGTSNHEFQGIVIIVFAMGDFVDSKQLLKEAQKFDDGEFEMTVNGIPVKSLVKIDAGTYFLRGADGLHFEANTVGEYEIAVHPKVPDTSVRLSAIIVF